MALVTAPLLGITPATPRTRLLQIDLRGSRFDFQPGQAVLIAAHDRPLRRPYSIANSPERAAETQRLELLVGLEADGGLGAHLGSPAPGALIDVEGPLGTFTFPANATQSKLLFVAGGTGIAPLRSMIDHVLRQGRLRAVSVLYSARTRDEFAFIEELLELQGAGLLELHQTVTRDSSPAWPWGRGRIGRSHFEAVLHEPMSTLCFVCGPREMVAESVATLRTMGVPTDAIRTEAWKVPGV